MRRMRAVGLLFGVMFVPIAGAGEGIRVGQEFVLRAGAVGKGIRAMPAVAWGGGAYLVVWREGWHGKGGSARIQAASVSAEGKLLDADGMVVTPAATGVQERPRVAFADGTFLVVWQELRDGRDYDVVGARIGPDGRAKDRRPIVIAGGPRNQALPDVAGSAKRFVVVWQGLRGEETAYRGYAATVSAEGEVGPAVEIQITPQPRIAWNGTEYLVTGGGGSGARGKVWAAGLGPDGTPKGKPAMVIRGTKLACFSLCGAPGEGWLVVSHRSPPDPWGWGGPGAIRAASVNPHGQTVNQDAIKEPAGVKERLPGWLDFGRAKKAGATWLWGPSACAFDGKLPVVVWQRHHLCGAKFTTFENCDLIAARVSGYRSLDPQGVPVASTSAEEQAPALASDGDGGLLVVYERRDADGRVSIAGRLLRTR